MNEKIKKQAEEYSTKKTIKFVSNIDSKPYDEIYNAVLYGAELAHQWNSPDERPEKEKEFNVSKTILFICDDGYQLGYYDFEDDKWWSYHDIDFAQIDGWMYLPEPIKK